MLKFFEAMEVMVGGAIALLLLVALVEYTEPEEEPTYMAQCVTGGTLVTYRNITDFRGNFDRLRFTFANGAEASFTGANCIIVEQTGE